MQTFLPYPSYTLSARYLDSERLGKQRSESKIILRTLLGEYERMGRTGWPHHPATKMWQGHEYHLTLYSIEIAREWIARGNRDTTLEWFLQKEEELSDRAHTGAPSWLGDPEFHKSHRSNLLRKAPDWYEQFDWTEGPGLPYVWPVPTGRPGGYVDIFSTYYIPGQYRPPRQLLFEYLEVNGEEMRMFACPSLSFFREYLSQPP